jgi:beta-galactosidase
MAFVRRILVLFIVMAICCASSFAETVTFSDSLESVQGREATPAVVNPALRSGLRQTLSLDGEWQFATDPERRGEQDVWYRPDVPLPNPRSIQVPGCWEAQGVGGKGATRMIERTAARPLRGSYKGTAWYKKEMTVPAEWRGKEIWLKFGGVHAQGWFWANGTFLGHDKSYCGTYKYRVTDLIDAEGKLVIAAKVRNDLRSAKGLYRWLHSWGGLYRSVELDATSLVLVDYAYVEGDFDAKSAAVHVSLRSTATESQQVEVAVTVSTLDGQRAGHASETLTMGRDRTRDLVLKTKLVPFNAWSPKHPNLYRADIVIKHDGKVVDGWVERFGVRKWEVRGGELYLNNRKHFVRGFGDDYIYPLTLSSPPSREFHREHLRLARSFGFNYVRHHTHCETPEFFEAADELGIMIQPELPYGGGGKGKWFRPKEDLRELVTHYRRYVSTSTYCGGNEGYMGSPMDKEIYALAKELDPTRLFLHQDGGRNYPAEYSDLGTGFVSDWKPKKIYHESWDAPECYESKPWFCHEYMNLTVAKDPRLAWKFTGVQFPSVPVEPYLRELRDSGLSIEWGNKLLDSGHYLQRLWQKIGLESARLDPFCDGYIYWTMMDVDYFGDQGLLDMFWNVKKTTPRFFRRFNSPTAVLAAHEQYPIGADQRILAEGDKLQVDWWINHFDDAPLDGAALTWRVETDSCVVGCGRIDNIKAKVGDVKQVGIGSLIIRNVEKPVKARLIAGLENMAVENSWELWLFPKLHPKKDAGKGLAASGNVYNVLKSRYRGLVPANKPEARDAEVLITDSIDGTALEALNDGKSVFLVSLQGPAPGVKPWWWSSRAQAGTVIADHVAFGDFPHDGYLNHLFFRLIKNTVICRDEMYRDVEKLMVNVGNLEIKTEKRPPDWTNDYLVHVFQANSGKGKLFACGLDVLSENPEAVYLLNQFIDYVRSPWFDPQGEFDLEVARLHHEEVKREFNGWSETVVSKSQVQNSSFLGELMIDVARFARDEKEVAWLTQPVPKDLKADAKHTFKWVAGLGWISEPAAEFQLMLGDRKLLSFGVTQKEKTWKSDDGAVTLHYAPVSAENGTMELTLPASMLEPGEKALLRVLAPQTGSQRWFGIYHYP